MKNISTNRLEDIIKQSSTNKSILFDFRKTWVAYITLAVLIVASFFIQKVVQQKVDSDLNTEFEKSYSAVISRLNNQYDRLYQVMKSMQGLYDRGTNVQVVRDIFELSAATPVKNYSSIMCIAYAPKVMDYMYGEYKYYALSESYNSYDIHPYEKREYYYPIEHIVEYNSNVAKVDYGNPSSHLAFDYASDPIMKTAIELATEKQQNVISTEFFNLRPDTLSFAMVAAIYGSPYYVPKKESTVFIGSLVMEIDATKYFNNAITGADDIENGKIASFPSDSQIVFTIIDKNYRGDENTIYKSNNYSEVSNSNVTPLLTKDVTISIANRDLTVKFETAPTFGDSTQINLPIIVLIVALLLSVLAFILIIVLLTQKARAEEIAERMTASQRRILDISRDIIAVVDVDGKWLSVNPVAKILLETELGKIIETKITDYFYDTKDYSVWEDILSTNKEQYKMDIKIKSNNELGYIWMNWNFTYPKNENLIYAIGRDVTLERQAEEEIKFHSKQIELANTIGEEASINKVHLMIQLNMEMRNQLTSMMGYLQLITSDSYENDDELKEFAGSAYESAESAYTYISDISEATIGDDDTLSRFNLYTIGDIVNATLKETKQNNDVKFVDKSKEAHIICDKDIFIEVWTKIFRILTYSNPQNTIKITANENKLENITEISIEASTFKELEQLIKIYNIAPKSVINELRKDIDDILLDIAKVASYITRMSGTFRIECIDEGKEAYIFISLPLTSRNKE